MTPDYTPKGIGRLVDEAIAVYRAEFRTLALPALYVLLPAGLLLGLAQGWYTQAVVRTAAAATSPDPISTLGAVFGAYSLVIAAASLQSLVALYYFACLLVASPELLARRPVPPAAFLKGGARRFLMLFVIWLAVAVLAGIGFVFLIVPGVLVSVYLSMAQSVSGVEGAPLDRSFSRSVALVRGHFWRTVGFFIAVGIIVLSLETAISSLASVQLVLQGISGAASGNPMPSFGWQVLSGVLGSVGQAVALPLSYVATLLYYLDLRARREGLDLLVRAQALAA